MNEMEMTPEQAVSQYTAEEGAEIVQQLLAKIARLRVSHHMEVHRLTKERDTALDEVEDLRRQLAPEEEPSVD